MKAKFKTIINQFRNPDVQFAVIDLFCGGGGTSTGMESSKHARVVWCVNHDPNAILSHAANYPIPIHSVEKIEELELSGMIKLVELIREKFPHIKIILWASLECTNFSKAKGGQPRDADSRTLAEHLYRYVEAVSPDYIQIENVVEFMSWGPLDENNKPVSRKNGSEWLKWREHINEYGYRDEWRELNSANYGAYTSRNRLFGIFAKDDLPIVWPEPTHSKNVKKDSIFGNNLKKWKPVKDCLDFSDEGKSIFNRKKPLVEPTEKRIYEGLVKFVANGDESFLQKAYSGSPTDKVVSLENPHPTITTIPHESVVFITKYNSTQANGKVSPGHSVNEPCPTVTVQQRLALTYLVKFNNNEHLLSVDNPSPVLTTKDKLGVVMMKYHGNGKNLLDPESACSTLTTKDRIGVVFLDQQYGNSKPSSIENPAATITNNPKLAACFIDRPFTQGCEKFLMSTQFNNVGSSLENPAPVITANRKHHYLVNPQYASKGGSIENPAFTLIARMDKMPPYLVTTEKGEAAIVVYETDSETMKKIKLFMAHYGIVDIKMRMLKILELLKIQGFPPGYQLVGTQTDQKKFIGNSVVPMVVTAWINALATKIIRLQHAAWPDTKTPDTG